MANEYEKKIVKWTKQISDFNQWKILRMPNTARLLVYLFDWASNHFYLSKYISSKTLRDVQLYEHAIPFVCNKRETERK